jgi:hypothetical protein
MASSTRSSGGRPVLAASSRRRDSVSGESRTTILDSLETCLGMSKTNESGIMTITILELDKKTYGRLLSRALLHVIHTEEECGRLTNELMRLDERIDSSPEEKELAELLTVLIDEYETRRCPIPKASPRQTLDI